LAQVIEGSFPIESGYRGTDRCASTVALDLNRSDG
jgi:hypothetical protein